MVSMQWWYIMEAHYMEVTILLMLDSVPIMGHAIHHCLSIFLAIIVMQPILASGTTSVTLRFPLDVNLVKFSDVKPTCCSMNCYL